MRGRPYAVVDWFTMLRESTFDSVRESYSANYTGPADRAFLVLGSKDQWRTIRGAAPLTYREVIKYVEVPPPRK